MLKIIIALVFLGGAIFLGPRLADSQGFVHIATNEYIIETSLTTAVIIAVFAFLILHVVINVLFRSITLPKSTLHWFGKHSAKRRQQLQNEAFMAFEEGSYTRALSLLKKSGQDKLPTHCLFLAAKCAFETNDLENCRKYLDQAESHTDCSDLACKLLRAQLNLKLDNVEAALENLLAIEKDSYNSAITTRLLFQCYEKIGNYEKMEELLPNLKTLKIFDSETLSNISQNCLEHKLSQTQNEEDVLVLVDKLSRSEKQNSNFMLPVINRLLQLNAIEKAGRYALSLVKEQNSSQLYETISNWPEESSSLLHALELKLQDESADSANNASLLKALANLEMRSEKFEEAQTHLDRALELQASRNGYMLAVELSQRTNKPEEANKFMALALTQN